MKVKLHKKVAVGEANCFLASPVKGEVPRNEAEGV